MDRNRYRAPLNFVTEQKLQLQGQPREVWTEWIMYFFEKSFLFIVGIFAIEREGRGAVERLHSCRFRNPP